MKSPCLSGEKLIPQVQTRAARPGNLVDILYLYISARLFSFQLVYSAFSKGAHFNEIQTLRLFVFLTRRLM